MTPEARRRNDDLIFRAIMAGRRCTPADYDRAAKAADERETEEPDPFDGVPSDTRRVGPNGEPVITPSL